MIFLSHLIDNDTPTYGDSSGIKISHATCMDHGDTANSLSIKMNNHIGTHIDLPKHFDNNGKVLEQYPACEWVFNKVQLVNIPLKEDEMLSISHLKKKLREDIEVLIIKTGFEKFRHQKSYWKNNPGVLPEVGTWLRRNFSSIKIIGFDFISLTCFQKREIGRISHRAFLGSDKNNEPIRIIEDMKLSEIDTDPKKLVVLPLMIKGADGVPVNIIAF